MAKADDLAEAKALGLDVDDSMTVAQIHAAIDAHVWDDAEPRPTWDAGETRQQYHARLSAWQTDHPADPSGSDSDAVTAV